MNKHTQLQWNTKQTNNPFGKLIFSLLGAAFLAVGVFIGVPQANAATVSASDQEFMMAAAQGGMLEVKLGDLAAQKGTRDDVKNFGQKMVTDHTQINNDMKALAGQKGVGLPDGLDAKHQAMYDKLAALSGPDFDKEYIASMIKAHKKDLKSFKKESADTQDADIKSALDKAIPVVEMHLNMIEGIKKQSA